MYLQDETHPEYGVVLKYKHGNRCTDQKNYGLELQINCDPLALDTKYFIDPTSLKDDECHPRVVMTSAAGCPTFSMPALWRWSDQNSIIVGIVLVVVGGLLIQFGPTYDKASLIAIATLSMSTMVLILVHALIMPNSTPQWMVWITIAMAIGIGIGAGFGVFLWPKAGVVSVGMALGSIFGLVIYIIFMSDISTDLVEVGIQNGVEGNTTVNGVEKTFADIEAEEWFQLISSIAVCQVVFSILCVIFYEVAVICGTCVIGSYLVVRGISKVIGHFPNEFMIYDSIKNQRLFQNNNWMWIYLVVMLVLALVSVKRQWSNRKTVLSSNEYKKYDFRLRAPSAQPGTGVSRRPTGRVPSGSVQPPSKSAGKYGLMAEDEEPLRSSRDERD